jgi:lysophospholipase L1-like esterase
MRRALLSALMVGVLLGATSGTALARREARQTVTPRTPVTRGSGYVALGDSVTFGYQESGVVPTPNYHNPSSFVAYPEQLGSALGLKVTNLACPGETSESLINEKDTLACENAYRKDFPLHVRYKGSQLAYSLSFLRKHKGVRLVSLMIGANDYFLCQHTEAGCATTADLRGLTAEIGRHVRQTLSAIRKRGRYSGQLAVVNYYSLNYASPATNALSLLLDRTLDTAARPFRAEIADGYGIFQTASFRFADQPCLAGLITQLNGQASTCGIHPTYTGQALLAQALLKAIRVGSRPAKGS